MDKKRLYGRQYELARIYAPVKEGEYILSKRKELKQGRGREVWLDLRKDERMARNYDEQLRYNYLRGIFFCLSTKTPITVVRTAGTVMHIATNELEREDGFREVECMELSLRVHLQDYQIPMVEEMAGIVDAKMKSFATDFYLHDMMPLARVLGEHHVLWVCGQSHTFMEVLDAAGDAEWLIEHLDDDACRRYLREDDTWMGSALRVAIGQEDWLYYHDGTMLHKVRRDRFETIHRNHIERVRELVMEHVEHKKAA